MASSHAMTKLCFNLDFKTGNKIKKKVSHFAIPFFLLFHKLPLKTPILSFSF